MGINEVKNPQEEKVLNNENIIENFSPAEIKLLNLIAEIIVNNSIKESYEKGNQVSTFQ